MGETNGSLTVCFRL